MYCLRGCPRGAYRSSPYPQAECLMVGYRSPIALQDVYLKGSRTALTRWRSIPVPACPVPARMMQESMQLIAWKYFQNLMCSRRQKFPQ